MEPTDPKNVSVWDRLVEEPETAPLVLSDSDDSFVVLETCSNESQSTFEDDFSLIYNKVTKEMLSAVNHDLMKLTSNTNSLEKKVDVSETNACASLEPQYGKVQKHIDELIKENAQLQDTIAQNNMSMLTHRERVMAWKDDVDEICNGYKMKIVETRKQIEKLKEERRKLTDEVEKYKHIKELQEEEIVNMKLMLMETSERSTDEKQLDYSKEISQLKAETGKLTQQITSLNGELKRKELVIGELQKDLETSVAELASHENAVKAKLLEVRADNIKLTETLNKAKKENYDLRSILIDAELKGTRVDELESKVKELTEVLEKTHIQGGIPRENSMQNILEITKEENVKLKEQIREMQKLETELSSKDAEVKQLTEKYEEMISSKDAEIKKLQDDLRYSKMEYERKEHLLIKTENELRSVLHKTTEENRALKKENEELLNNEKILTKEKEKLSGEFVETKHAELTKLYEQLREELHLKEIEIDKVSGQLNEERRRAKAIETALAEQTQRNDQLRQQLMHSQSVVTTLKEELDNKNTELQKSLKSAEEVNNEILALKEQLDVYKSDFEIEKTSRQSLKSERDDLAEDIQNLMKHNKELRDEIELLRKHDFEVLPSPSKSLPNAAMRISESPTFTRYSCPICNMQFRSLKLIQEHVENCPSTPFT